MTSRYFIGIALISTLLGAGWRATAQPTGAPQAAAASSGIEVKLELRKLWSDRAFWSHTYIVAAVNEAPDADAALKRLSQNDESLARTLTAFYGESAGRDLLRLFHEQSTTLGSLGRAAKTSKGTLGTSASDPTNMQALLQRWHGSRDTMNAVLQRGEDSSDTGLAEALQLYLSATMKELSARVNGDWAGDAQAFDEAHDSALRVADAIAKHVALQFQPKAGSTGTSGVR